MVSDPDYNSISCNTYFHGPDVVKGRGDYYYSFDMEKNEVECVPRTSTGHRLPG